MHKLSVEIAMMLFDLWRTLRVQCPSSKKSVAWIGMVISLSCLLLGQYAWAAQPLDRHAVTPLILPTEPKISSGDGVGNHQYIIDVDDQQSVIPRVPAAGTRRERSKVQGQNTVGGGVDREGFRIVVWPPRPW
jgi:hypothetical protein